jgi:metallophosphoesterase (TIGR00282 family)
MKILIVGDIVARPGRDYVREVLPGVIKEHGVEFTIANAENIAHGRGVTKKTLEELMNVGVDFFTSGDHVFWQKDSIDDIESFPIIRPANFPSNLPGEGHALVDAGKFGNILIINLMGRVSFNNQLVDDPFRKVDEILEENKDKEVAYTIVDFHAEATSEKAALGFYLDGRVDAVVGTHTHVPTCDNRVLPDGTLFISDIGMTGIIDSVLGVEKDIIIKQFLSGMNQRFEWENTGTKAFRSVLLDTQKGAITRIDL